PNIFFVCFSEYDHEFQLPIAFPQTKIPNNLGKCLSDAGLRQLRMAETEKYAHVTFFFNSQVEDPFPKEERILIPSPKVPSYETQPEMSAEGITEKALAALEKKNYDFVLINFANPDLVGHSGNYQATVKACEVVDACVGKIVVAVLKKDGVVLLTGDHGNAEQMFYPNGEPCPAHTTNKVPFSLISNHISHALHEDGGLQDIGPTILRLLDIQKPEEMTGKSLV
ncbi:MAG: alkaline phosphatase family protein, partial [Nanoarchaeota archaeon]